MYTLLNNILSDKKGGEIFTLFGAWHFFYIILTVIAAAVLIFLLKNKSADAKKKTVRTLSSLSFAFYIADFFLMPLAYGEIDIEKLPFHACTAMCVACFLSYRIGFLENYRASFAMLGFISNLVYLVYPAGVMWHAVHPLSYRVIQTLLFHSIMTLACFFALIYESDKINIRKCHRDLAVTIGMTAWASLGNLIYNNDSRFYNWFFVVRDPFNALPESTAPFIMPFLNIAIFFTVEILIHIIFSIIKGGRK
ncbi:MAG: YwaF family protein [Clostridia bacterium]|nr:YwaF family protein [Clostridia bacterium]